MQVRRSCSWKDHLLRSVSRSPNGGIYAKKECFASQTLDHFSVVVEKVGGLNPCMPRRKHHGAVSKVIAVVRRLASSPPTSAYIQ